VRMVLTATGLGALALHLPAGALLNGFYLCMSWRAIGEGMPAGVMALLGALQPLVVARRC